MASIDPKVLAKGEDLMGSVEAIVSLCAARDVNCRALGPIDDTGSVDLDVRWA